MIDYKTGESVDVSSSAFFYVKSCRQSLAKSIQNIPFYVRTNRFFTRIEYGGNWVCSMGYVLYVPYVTEKKISRQVKPTGGSQ